MNTLDKLFSGGAKSAFSGSTVVGETVTGPIVSAIERQSTDFATKQPETWDDGSPKMQVVVTIDTDQRLDANDDGQRSVYIKTWGLDKQAFLQAIKNAGYTKASEALAPGNLFTATFTGTQPSKYGSDQKIYQYSIRKGASPSLDQALNTAPAAPAAQPAPAQAQMPNPWTQVLAQIPVQQAAPATPPAPAPQAPTPAQQAASVAAQAPSDPQAMIRAGWTDEQIGAATGLTPDVLAMLRQYVPQ